MRGAIEAPLIYFGAEYFADKIFNCVFCFSYSIFYDYMVYYVLATYTNKKIHIIWSGKYYEYLCFHRTPSAKAEIFE